MIGICKLSYKNRQEKPQNVNNVDFTGYQINHNYYFAAMSDLRASCLQIRLSLEGFDNMKTLAKH